MGRNWGAINIQWCSGKPSCGYECGTQRRCDKTLYLACGQTLYLKMAVVDSASSLLEQCTFFWSQEYPANNDFLAENQGVGFIQATVLTISCLKLGLSTATVMPPKSIYLEGTANMLRSTHLYISSLACKSPKIHQMLALVRLDNFMYSLRILEAIHVACI